MDDIEILDFGLPIDYKGMSIFEMFESMIEVINHKKSLEYKPRELYCLCRVGRENFEEYMKIEGHNLSTALVEGIVAPMF